MDRTVVSNSNHIISYSKCDRQSYLEYLFIFAKELVEKLMPKETFHNLNSEKKEAFIEAFMYEFSHRTYEEASITSVVKTLGIAKGSVYQYFDGKLDLLLYLKE